jgi:hypothetical protein
MKVEEVISIGEYNARAQLEWPHLVQDKPGQIVQATVLVRAFLDCLSIQADGA